MRITGGRAKGIRLQLPKGNLVRPAMDRMRQAVFSSLGSFVDGIGFVDLFAGSGSYGLEALSRGASRGVFVERDHHALQCLRANLAAVCKSAELDLRAFQIVSTDAFSWEPAEKLVAELVFADPPYHLIEANAAKLFARFDSILSLDRSATIVFEMPSELELEHPDWKLLKRVGGGGPGSAVACLYARKTAMSPAI